MSWWNTSNLTDFASKALKNAQKTIDKALDIPVEEQASAASTKDAKANTKSKVKTDFWSTWSTSDDGAGSSTSSWSLPWASAADEQKEAESVFQEKTAEEIRSEVLRVAKERTKAKSKLFSKSSLMSPKEEVSSEELEVKSKFDPLQEEKERRASKADLSQVIEFMEEVKMTDQGRLESEPVTVVAEASASTSHVATEGDSDELLEQFKDNDAAASTESTSLELNLALIEGTLSLTDRAILSVDSVEKEADISFERALCLSMGYKETEGNNKDTHHIDDSVKECEHEAQHMSETHGSLVDKERAVDPSETLHVPTEKDIKASVEAFKGTVPLDNESFHKTHECTVINENDMQSVSPDTDKVIVNKICASLQDAADFNKDAANNIPETIADISSSVEFVTENDLLNVLGSVNETFTDVEQEDIGQADQSGSDPDTIYCDKTDSANFDGAHTNNGIENTRKVKIENDTQNKEALDESVFNKTQHLKDVIEENKHEKMEEICSCVSDLSRDSALDNDSCVMIPSSESESSMAKLDTSLETSASEDTLVEAQSPYSRKVEESEDTAAEDAGGSGHNTSWDITADDSRDEEVSCTSEVADNMTQDVSDNKDREASSSDKNRDSSSSDGNKGELSPANSFVKCMLEDALEEGKLDDNSDSLSGNSKSDGSRSIYSNHESGDEIDTTTSSDIEIISLPTSNDDSKLVSHLDPVPLRIALQKTSWRGSPTHKRTDSSDSSNASNHGSELSPGRDNLDYHDFPRSHHEHIEGSRICELPALSEEDDNPYHPQRLLKKLAEMSEVLQARESKLLQLSKDNCDLMETNSILRSQLRLSEEARESEMTDVNELTTEFTARLTEAEKRVTTAIKEKELVKKQLMEVQRELMLRDGDMSLKQLIAEKDEQIAELLQEGEKLSKSQLQSNTIIKKLRQKEKDNEGTITSQKQKLDKQKEELDHLHKVLEAKEEMEKKQTEAISQLNAAVNKQEQEMIRLKTEHEDAVEKARGLQVALDNSYKEMKELHRNTVVMDNKAQEAALSAEMQVREELKMAMEKQAQKHKWERDSLSIQIEDLRLSMARMEKDHNRREDLLKQEIADLHKQLQEDEARTQELTQGVSLATRPLLRQIENLQSNFNAQSTTWERVEKSLTDRLGETQTSLAIALENERMSSERVMDLESRVTSLETQNSRLRQEKSILIAQQDALKARVEVAEDAKQSDAAQLEVVKQHMSKEITDLKKQTVLYETQLDMERSRLDQEKKRVIMLQDQIRDMEQEHQQRSRSQGSPTRVMSTHHTPSPVSVSRQDSVTCSLHEHSFAAITQDELDRSFILSTPNGNKQSLYEALRQSGASNLLENLQSQLKMREGEIMHLQGEIRSLERTRESMARELVDLSNQNDVLEEKVKGMPQLETQYKELDQRYNALLQMYGEKVEEAEELKMDLQDVKDMYKAQINQLLSQSR